MRKKIVAGNWKMNNGLVESQGLINNILEHTIPANVGVMLAPSFTNLQAAVQALNESAIDVVAQNMHDESNGAFTGEVSAKMLKSIGVNTVILGHSERRAIFGETDSILARKVSMAIEQNMTAIFCFGEELEDRKSNNHFALVESQLKHGLFNISNADWQNIILAYEPVWAIGTGETASPEQAQEMHAFIRKVISENYSSDISEAVSILYGGSVKASNASEIFSKPDVDGGLIGGASLDADSFMAIVNSF
jgi:triosephosphate isomerase